MLDAFSASLIARIAYDAGCISSTNSDSPGSAIEPSLLRLIRNACWWSSREISFDARIDGGVASDAVAPSAASTAALADSTAAVEREWILEVAELPLDDQDPSLHLGVLEHHVGQRLDVEPGSDLDHLRRHPRPRQPAAYPRAEVAHRLRLQLVDEDR